MSQHTFTIDLEPVGRRAQISAHQTLLEAAQTAGVALVAICGGAGNCLDCRVRLVKGTLTPPSLVEEAAFTPEELESGMRLACQAYPQSDIKLEIPPESLSTTQRLQTEGTENHLELDLPIRMVEVHLDAPTLADLRSLADRLRDALRSAGVEGRVQINLPVLAEITAALPALAWQGRAVLRGDEVIALLPTGKAALGLAVDVGTTKLAAYLVEMETGSILARTGAMNPQIAYGEDVVSRIAYLNDPAHDPHLLQRRLVETLNGLAAELCAQVNASPAQVVEAVLVGNTAMHHILAGLPARTLGEAPYVAAESQAMDFPAAQIGLQFAAGTYVHLPPNIAGYVGGDHIAMLLATEAWAAQEPTVALDIGTNTEISLAAGGQLYTCSCASGPAFEGAHISAGMRAAPGAIERVQVLEGQFRTFTIEHQAAVGICGSGILDAVAAMLAEGIIDRRGALRKENPHVALNEHNEAAFTLIPAGESGSGRAIHVTRKDVNEIQLAKSAIRAGVEVLLREAGLQAEQLRQFIVAGAFGTYLYLPSAVHIGMFPALPAERFAQVGNAAGTGARMLLLSKRVRARAQQILERVHYVELTTHPAFVDCYMEAMALGE